MMIPYILLGVVLASLASFLLFIFFKKVWSPGNKLIKKVSKELRLELGEVQKNKNLTATGRYKGYNLSISKKIDLEGNFWLTADAIIPPFTPTVDMVVELEIGTKDLPIVIFSTKFLGQPNLVGTPAAKSLKLFRNKKFDVYIEPDREHHYDKLINKYFENIFQSLFYSHIVIEGSRITFHKPYTLDFISPGINYKSLIKKIDLLVAIAGELEDSYGKK